MQVSLNGTDWRTYQEHGAPATFQSSRAPAALALTATFAQHIRISPLHGSVSPTLRVGVLGRSIGGFAGLADGRVRDEQLTASSALRPATGAAACRLWGAAAWQPASSNSKQHVQIDLGEVSTLSAVLLQGSVAGDAFVTELVIECSIDGRDFVSLGPFSCLDSSAWATVLLPEPRLARHVRLVPQCWQGTIALRAEMLVTSAGTALGLQQGTHPDGLLTASTSLAGHPASQARLNTGQGWVGDDSTQAQWLQVDLGCEAEIAGLAMQGVAKHNAWVTSFSISTSKDGRLWDVYKRRNGVAVFSGNGDIQHMQNLLLAPPARGRLLRIVPLSWHNRPALRLEVFVSAAGVLPAVAVEDEVRALEMEAQRVAALVRANALHLGALHRAFERSLDLPRSVLGAVGSVVASVEGLYRQGAEAVERLAGVVDPDTLSSGWRVAEACVEGLGQRADGLDELCESVEQQLQSLGADVERASTISSDLSDAVLLEPLVRRASSAVAELDSATEGSAALIARVRAAQSLVESALILRKEAVVHLEQLENALDVVGDSVVERIGGAMQV